MAQRSLRASQQGIAKAEKAFRRTELTQKELAKEVGLKSRNSVWKFFKGERIARHIFKEICSRLDLDWEEIAATEPTQGDHNSNTDINSLVLEVRKKIHPSIQKRCGTMRVLDMTQPIGLVDIYTKVNILEKITGSMRLEIADLLRGFDPDLDNFDYLGLSRITSQGLPGLEVVADYPKLIVLGKPGSGKTTFLKYLALECSSGCFLTHLVPIFVTLRDCAESLNQPSCLDFICQLLSNSGIAATQTVQLIEQGRALILLDGLDELTEEDANRVIKQIREFADRYHANQFVITCRIAAQDYLFDQFTEVEVADFNAKQINEFVTKWFQTKELDLAEEFLAQLKSNPPIKELATNPLLLTLLCLEFEDSGDFPFDRAELYRRGIATLLIKWDAKRGIVRDRVYQKLSGQRKQDLLSQLALNTFERKHYLFKQQLVERYIADYIRNLPDAETDPEALHLDSEAILKSIEAQHGLLVERAKGIYSFSHLTFHEYFTARKIVTSSDPQALEKTLQSLVSHITEKSWREVFLLTVGMLQPADYLLGLMKQQVDVLIAADETLQQFLRWVREKSQSVKVPYKPAAVRAFYFNLARNHYSRYDPTPAPKADLISILDRHLYIFRLLGYNQTLDIGLDELLTLASERAFQLASARTRHTYAFKGAFFLACDRAISLDPHLGQTLQELKQQLPNLEGNERTLTEWWTSHGLDWIQQLADAIATHRNIVHNWQFTAQQHKLLKQYYDANRLLVDCLYSDCYVSREVRQEIEDTLLLSSLDR